MFPDTKKNQSKKILIGFIIILIGTNLINFFMFGYRPADSQIDRHELDPGYALDMTKLPEELALFGEVIELVSGYFFETVDPAVLVRGAIEGALAALEDPQTRFYDTRELQNFLTHTTGSFSGIGVRIIDVDDSVVIFETIENTPAQRAGLYPGDRIRSAAGEDLTGQGVERAVELLRGPKGTIVKIAVERPGAAETLTITLERDDIQMATVSSRMLETGLGYIEISNFDSHTGSSFSEQLRVLEGMGLDKGLILDLRGNPGGLVDQAVQVAEELVPEGEITRLVDRNGAIQSIHYSTAPLKPYPLIVLVNEGTASAAEIVAGALQDHDAALLVGTTTYGKATVQHLERLSGENALQLTVAKYLTPSGRDLHKQGLEPDYLIELPAALKYYRYFLPGRLEKGSYGPQVELLQEMLAELGYEITPDGYYDDVTAQALASFQKSAGLTASGLFDDLTWIQLREALDQAALTSDAQLQKAVDLTGQAALWAHLRR